MHTLYDPACVHFAQKLKTTFFALEVPQAKSAMLVPSIRVKIAQVSPKTLGDAVDVIVYAIDFENPVGASEEF
jgi:hypothetical protein